MRMESVEGSSNVDQVGYDPESKVLRVKFKSGGTYDCQDMSSEEHHAFMSADSKGGHFARHIKGHKEVSKL